MIEAQPNHHTHVNGCHQVIFKELDELKATVSGLQQVCGSPQHKAAVADGKCLQRSAHAMSMPSFTKVTEVENRIVSGSMQYNYINRHHLDDTQMKEALHWDQPDNDQDTTIKHYEHHRQTYKHRQTEPAVYVFEEKKTGATSPRFRDNGRHKKTKADVKSTQKLAEQQAIAEASTKKFTHQIGSTAQPPKRGKPEVINIQPEDDSTRRILKERKPKQMTNPSTKELREYLPRSERPQSEWEQTPYKSQQSQRRLADDNTDYNRQTFGQNQQTRHRKKQQHYKPLQQYAIDMRNNGDKHMENRAYRDFATFGSRHPQYTEMSNRPQQYSSSNTITSHRKEGYLTRKRRTKHVYPQLEVSSDSYFSPYEDEL